MDDAANRHSPQYDPQTNLRRAATDGSYGKLLGQLEIALTRQLNLASRGDLEAVRVLAANVETMLYQANAAEPFGKPASAHRLERIRRLHNKLRVTIESKKAQANRRFGRLRRQRHPQPVFGNGR